MRHHHLKAALLLVALMLTGIGLSACDTIDHAWKNVRDAVD